MGDIKALLIVMVIVGGMSVGVSQFYNNLAVSYNVSDSRLTSLSAQGQTKGLITNISGKINYTADDSANQMAFIPPQYRDAVSLTSGSINIFTNLVSQANSTSSFPPNTIPIWISTMVIAIVSIIVTLGIIAAVMKWDI